MEIQGLSTTLVRLRFQQEETFSNLRRVAVSVHKEETPDRADLVACVDLIQRQCEAISGLCLMAEKSVAKQDPDA